MKLLLDLHLNIIEITRSPQQQTGRQIDREKETEMDTTLAIAQAQGECLRQARSTITELEDEVRRLRASEAALAQRLGDTERELDSVARLCTLARDKSAAEQQAREKLQHSLEVTHAKYVRARDALRQAGDELNRSTEESASVREEYSASLDSVRRWKEKLMASKTAYGSSWGWVARQGRRSPGATSRCVCVGSHQFAQMKKYSF